MLTGETQDAALARVGRALADPTRCRLLVALLDGPGYPAQLAEALGLSRSNVSNHLACPRGCGLVAPPPPGLRARGRVARGPSDPLRDRRPPPRDGPAGDGAGRARGVAVPGVPGRG